MRQEISFAEMRNWPVGDRSWYVYRMFDHDGECIYVGSTGWLRKRGQGHFARPRFPLVLIADVDIKAYPDSEVMVAAEAYWQERLSPPFNRLRPRGHRRR